MASYTGTTGNDTLVGSDANDFIYGGAGNDTISGGAGSDTLDGGTGDDTFLLGATFDNDTVLGGTGIDTAKTTAKVADVVVGKINATTWGIATTGGAPMATLQGVEHIVVDDYDFWTDGRNNNPYAVADTRTLTEDTTATGNVLTNDIDWDAGDKATLKVEAKTVETGWGKLVISTNGSYTFAPNEAAQALPEGKVQLVGTYDYKVYDSRGGTDSGSLKLTLTGKNDAPQVTAEVITINEDAGLGGGNVLANDRDADAGSSLSVKMVADADNNPSLNTYVGQYGVLTLAPNGAYTYQVSAAGQEALDHVAHGTYVSETFNYIVRDDRGAETAATFTANIQALDEVVVWTGDKNVNAQTGGAQNDTLDGGEGNDTLNGGAGNDTLIGGPETWSGTGQYPSDKDVLHGNAGNDTLYGGWDADQLYGDANDDTIYGGSGNDHLLGGTENDTLDGGADNDGLYGEDGNDTLRGGSGADTLDGGAHDDSLEGGDGIDHLYGGSGNDTIYGGYATGTALNFDYLYGDGGEDTLHGGGATDELHGGSEADHLYGYGGADQLWGDEGDDTLEGGDGSDDLYGGDGIDHLNGGNGNDWFLADRGDDILDGGANGPANDPTPGGPRIGVGDTIEYANDMGVLVDLGRGYSMSDYSGYDRFTGIENVMGSWGNDNITGDDNANVLIGRVGFDTLDGAGGADILWSSGRGGTTMTGGSEADQFSFDATDDGGHVIRDFAASQGDKVVLRGFGLASGADAVTHVYTDATTHNAAFSLDGVTIYTNVQTLTANDFLLA